MQKKNKERDNHTIYQSINHTLSPSLGSGSCRGRAASIPRPTPARE